MIQTKIPLNNDTSIHNDLLGSSLKLISEVNSGLMYSSLSCLMWPTEQMTQLVLSWSNLRQILQHTTRKSEGSMISAKQAASLNQKFH